MTTEASTSPTISSPLTIHLTETALHIQGMTCGACISRIDKALRTVPGVQETSINLTTGMATILGQPDLIQLVTAVDHAGYSARILADTSAQTLREISEQFDLHQQHVGRRLLIGLIAGIPALLLDLFQERLIQMHTAFGFTDISFATLLLTTVVMLTTGRPFFTGAHRALRHFSANMDVLVATGSGVAYLYSLVLTLLKWFGMVPAHVYHTEFHAAIAIIILVTLGKYLESRANKRASSAVAGLATQTALTATRIRPDGSLESIAADQIALDDHLQILAHQSIPVDGEVVEGTGTADLSIITGESIPVELTKDARLPGGATLADGRIVLRATSTAATSTVSRIIHLVNSAQSSKTHIQGLADRVAAIFVPIVILLAIANFTAWLVFTHNWEKALLTTIATIVIACPCAMGLATPTAITVAIGTAARRGILFTNAAALETARRINLIIFDKTGTLTQGTPRVAQIIPAPDSRLTPQKLLQLAASIEQFSQHPLAMAIVKHSAAQSPPLALLEPADFHSSPGGGVTATLGDGKFAAGSFTFLTSLSIPIPPAALDDLAGQTPVLFADLRSHKLLGIITLRDALRPDAAETLQILHARGLQIGVLSGDSEPAVRNAFTGLSVDFIRAQVSPDQKASAIHELRGTYNPQRKRGPILPKPSIAFVGDGINDAPALAAADLGIAMTSGSDLAKAAGDVLLTRLIAIPFTIELAQKTLRIIKQNLFWAFAYNIAAIPLAMLGVLPPGVAAAAMILSSLTVVGNALRLHGGKSPNSRNP